MKRMITLAICLFAFISFTKADDDKTITVDQLPKKSLEFIQQYFPKTEVSFAKMDKGMWDKEYKVVFVNGNNIEFDKNGDWKEVDCKFSSVPEGIVPQAIKNHVAKQYPQAKILKIDRNAKKYEVKLNNKLELKFSPTFQLMEVDD